ncbi:MAG: phage tail protein [Myxococcota bacterium]
MNARMIRSLAFAATLAAGVAAHGSASAQEPYLGEIRCFGYNFVPVGWLPTDGRLLSIAANTALFSLLGTQFGGDGQVTFALPDLRGRSLVGVGQGPGLSPIYSPGEMGGAESVTLSTSQLPAHSHVVTEQGSPNDATLQSPANGVPATKARTTLYAPGPGTVPMSPTVTSTVGGNQPVPIRSPYLGVTCAIATAGIYPARN